MKRILFLFIILSLFLALNSTAQTSFKYKRINKLANKANTTQNPRQLFRLGKKLFRNPVMQLNTNAEISRYFDASTVLTNASLQAISRRLLNKRINNWLNKEFPEVYTTLAPPIIDGYELEIKPGKSGEQTFNISNGGYSISIAPYHNIKYSITDPHNNISKFKDQRFINIPPTQPSGDYTIVIKNNSNQSNAYTITIEQ